MLEYEQRLWHEGIDRIAGIDEAGRGPLAGPVVAAAVIFPSSVWLPDVDDSKKLTPRRRESLFPVIQDCALDVAVGRVDEKEIDRINILQATRLAMRMALGRLKERPQHLLIDGRGLPEKFFPQTAIIGGDRLSVSIAAASIIAKVTRDRIMIECDRLYPQYGFAQHKGYGTRQHIEAIGKYGLCPIHRRSFHLKGNRDF